MKQVLVTVDHFQGSVYSGGENIPKCKKGDVISVKDETWEAILKTFPKFFSLINTIYETDAKKLSFKNTYLPIKKYGEKFINVSIPFLDKKIFSNMPEELVYDMRNDRIGDAIGATAILLWLKNITNLKVSVIYDRKENRDLEYNWAGGINLFDWVEFKPYKIYAETPKGKTIISSYEGKDFSIWKTIKLLNLFPKMTCPSYLIEEVKQKYPFDYVCVHILNAIGARNTGYVTRRVLDMEKYSSIIKWLYDAKIKVIRLGARYDAIKRMPYCDDLSLKDLSLAESLAILSQSILYLGGDTGLTHAASALGIPVIIETDKDGKDLGGLNGIFPFLHTDIPYKTPLINYIKILMLHRSIYPFVKENNDLSIGIVITVFNRPKYLRQTLDSILASSIPTTNFLVVVVNDASTNLEIPNILDEYSKKFSQFHVITNKTNKHVWKSLPIGLDYLFLKNTDIMMNLDSDAIVRKDWLEKIIDLHKEYPTSIISGFNTTRNHPIGSERPTCYTKVSAGGINYVFRWGDYLSIIRPAFLRDSSWDWGVCDAIKEKGRELLITKPSVIQHIGVESTLGHHNIDVADDFVLDK
jgi:hypothetical protein